MIGHYSGAATDTKWLAVARDVGCSPAIVAALFFALLEHLQDDALEAWDAEAWALWAQVDVTIASAIVASLRRRSVIAKSTLAVLGRPGRDRTAAERARRYRERSRDDQEKVTANRDASRRDDRAKATANRDASRSAVTVCRDALSNPVVDNCENVTATVTEGGTIGGEVALSSSLLSSASISQKRESDAHALVEQMLEKLGEAGAIRSDAHRMLVKPRVVAWARQGRGLEDVVLAIKLARAARITAGSDQPLNVGYIEAKLAGATAAQSPHPAPQVGPPQPTKPRPVDRVAEAEAWARQMLEYRAITPEEAEAHLAKVRAAAASLEASA